MISSPFSSSPLSPLSSSPPLSSLKTLRITEASRVLPANLHKKEANSSVISEQSLEIQDTKASKDDHLTDSGGNQKPLTPSLKRKTIEVGPFFFLLLNG
ncbi:hypothetical protein PIB30_046742 [Stylosanthes scabra]|uniref:Uncharacterized protein n=1 Tax=Stylosanthes scabra TaxID=79078 RepID=A0ABU6SGM5_9FABA|nr:hypothetical protein [Stylosanthes scabra]